MVGLPAARSPAWIAAVIRAWPVSLAASAGIVRIRGIITVSPGACARDASLGGVAVEEVEVAHRAELVHLLAGKGPRLLVLLGTGADVGVRGQGLVGGQVEAGQGGRAGLLAPQPDPGGLLLRVLAAALIALRVDFAGGQRGQPHHLQVS